MDYTKLQNGSDIRGVAMEGIEGQHVNLTEQACRDIGRGFALWLRARLGKDTLRVAVGRDSRLSGPQLALWLMEAMAAEGLQVTDLGMASTPAMFMSTVTEGFAFDASVMITASHLPFNRNGYKFFTKDGGLEKQDIAAILALAGGSEHTGLPAGSIVTVLLREGPRAARRGYRGLALPRPRRLLPQPHPEPGKRGRHAVDHGRGPGIEGRSRHHL